MRNLHLQYKSILILALCTFYLAFSSRSVAHNKATYLGNSAVLVESEGSKILFDPFFHNNFGIYRLVPKTLYDAVMQGKAPYDDIDAIFISHAHEDHFSARDVQIYMEKFPNVLLFAPKQAIEKLAEPMTKINKERLIAFDLGFGDAPETQKQGSLIVTAVRIAHAGWPSRKDIENIVFSVTMASGKVAMHMGDADPDVYHYLPYRAHWRDHPVDINFPPYWFFMSAQGRDIINEVLNVRKNVGVHVPLQIPKYLIEKQYEHFSSPGADIKLD